MILDEKTNDTRFIPLLFVGVMSLVLGPFVLHFMGVDFSTNLVSSTALESGHFFLNKSFLSFEENAYYFLRGAFIHSLFEWSAFSLSLMIAFMSFVHYKANGNPVVPIMGTVFLISGCLDAYHLLVSTKLLAIPNITEETLSLSWSTCRIYNSIILLTCALYLYNYRSLSNVTYNGIKLRTLFFIGICLFIAIGGGVILSNISNPTNILKILSINSRITGPLELFPIVLLIIAIPIYYKIYKEEQTHFTFSILLSILPSMFTHIYMGLGSHERYDAFFNMSQFTEIIIYLVPFLGTVFDYLMTHEKMKLSEAKFRNLFMGSSDSVFLINSLGIFDCNKAALDLFGHKRRKTIVGRHLYEMSPNIQPSGESSTIEGRKKYAEVFANNCSNFEWMFRKQDGTYFESDVIMNRIKVGEVSFIQVVVRDISKRKVEERRLQNDLVNATQTSKLVALGEMSDGISHELNNPLAIIGACASKINRMLKYDNLDQQRLSELVSKISNTTFRAAEVVRNFQKFSYESKESDFSNYTVDEIIKQTKQLCQKKLQNEDIELKVSSPLNLKANCQISQVCQILLNLISNAKDICHEKDEKWIRIVVEEKDKMIAMRVIDPGFGIKEDILNKIYNPFFTTKEVGRGTGLGVSISKNLAFSQKGELYYELFEGHTSFVLEIPKVTSLSLVDELSKAA